MGLEGTEDLVEEGPPGEGHALVEPPVGSLRGQHMETTGQHQL